MGTTINNYTPIAWEDAVKKWGGQGIFACRCLFSDYGTTSMSNSIEFINWMEAFKVEMSILLVNVGNDIAYEPNIYNCRDFYDAGWEPYEAAFQEFKDKIKP